MKYDVIVIGGGVVGLASAYRILEQQPGTRLCILEKEAAIALHQTGNNSGVIHSGIYYKPGSLKAINCKTGYSQLLQFAAEHSIPHDICGKIIVATNKSELQALDNIYHRGLANDLKGIYKMNPDEVKEREPHVKAEAAIWVPQTGIIDYKEFSARLLQLIQHQGGEIFLNNKVEKIENDQSSFKITTSRAVYITSFVINCAGLYSDHIAQMTGQAQDLQIIPFRGEYFMLKPEKEYLVNNLIYPVPDPNFPFLGVHFTRLIHGGREAGPNAVLAFRREGYNKSDIHFRELFDILRFPGFHKIMKKYWREGLGEMYRSWSKTAFTKALQKLIPDIQKEDLVRGGSGVRAQTVDIEGNLSDDFVIFDQPGVLNVCNAPSPAATSSLSIGSTIANSYFKNKKR